MVGNINSEKTRRHIRNYIFPYLVSEQKLEALNTLVMHIDIREDDFLDGELCESPYTHTLASNINGHSKGTPIKIVGVELNEKTVVAKTKSHGDVPLSKVNKPKELKKPLMTKKGFDVEEKIASNLGGKGAGPTQKEFDFHYPPHPVKKKMVFGKVKHVPSTEKERADAIVRGESKLDRGKFGESAMTFDKKKNQWKFTNAKLGSKFAQAKKEGKPILKYMNEKFPEGVIDTGFGMDAPKGMAKHYLEQSMVNVLHIHDKATDTGTTYTIGQDNELKGKVKLSHLSHADINSLDGVVKVEKTSTGKTLIVHRPKRGVMKKFANASVKDKENHRSLADRAHAKEFMHHVNSYIQSKKQQQFKLNLASPGTHIPFYSPEEQFRIVR